GLAGALLVGVAAAKAYALALGKPLYGVNHLSAHVAVDLLENGPLDEPCVALLVSGGHSSLLLVPRVGGPDVTGLGATVGGPGGGALRKGGPPAGAAVPGRPADRQAGPRGRPRGDRVPAGDGRRPVRVLVRGAEDGGGPLGRGPRARRRDVPQGRRGGQLPGG